ncbi:carbohydrate-binding protein family 6 protein [Sporothrix schenckii 1099-18]|uniref:Carbohydrate-binding protein family 6 protein n=1 Tax=Sporothrix schenckii 1099-18 TaxID=1397361 RepID=A0A0F2MAF7_SPOSC|nr:carbohydrate-binding protein family 6 protein [Sporothrix schenckii 1099-18]KJR86059.1 carbohydrate-binding protein family 6 protein [Sporothrix schenckii 1099-18]
MKLFGGQGIRDASCYTVLFLVALLSMVNVSEADNPAIQTIYTADPAPFVYNGRMYLFADHDEDGSKTFVMKDWRLFSTTDMANWQDHGVVASLSTFKWATGRAWAGQVINRNNKFYYYLPMQKSSGAMAIGVGVADNVTGPYKDALGKPLVDNNNIDPTVWINDDGQAYLYYANTGFGYVKLNEDMISISGGPTSMARPTALTEGPWVDKRNGVYYLIYAGNGPTEDIRYATSSGPVGPWTYKGVIMTAQGSSFTNHPGIADYKNNSYFFYHDGALPGGGGYTRSICVEKFNYNADGTIPQIKWTTTGPPQIEDLNPYVRQEAETIAFSSGLKTEMSSAGGIHVTSINNGDYIKVNGVGFGNGTGAANFTASVASAGNGGKIELHLGSKTGTLIGTCTVPGTGGAQTWSSVNCPVSNTTGTHDLVFLFTGSGSGLLFNFDWWQFTRTS